jgi:hypothetical protein
MPGEEHGLAPLYEAFRQLPVVFEDGAVAEVRDELLAQDGVLVWINPIQDGANRSNVDAVLLEAASRCAPARSWLRGSSQRSPFPPAAPPAQ